MSIAPPPAKAPDIEVPHRLRQRVAQRRWQQVRRNRAALVAIFYLVVLVVVALAAPILAPHEPSQVFSGNTLRPPVWVMRPGQPEASGSALFLLGTDQIGRDVLSRLIYGTRASLAISIVPTVLTLLIGLGAGLLAGAYGGAVDAVVMRIVDIVNAFPAMLLFIVIMVALRDAPAGQLLGGFAVLVLALASVSWTDTARLVRGQMLSLREREFVLAARALGLGSWRIVLRHMLPNTLGPLVVMGVFLAPAAVVSEASLSYLGLGLRPSGQPGEVLPVSWGQMVLDGANVFASQPWLMISAAFGIASLTLALTLLGDALRDIFDPQTATHELV